MDRGIWGRGMAVLWTQPTLAQFMSDIVQIQVLSIVQMQFGQVVIATGVNLKRFVFFSDFFHTVINYLLLDNISVHSSC